MVGRRRYPTAEIQPACPAWRGTSLLQRRSRREILSGAHSSQNWREMKTRFTRRPRGVSGSALRKVYEIANHCGKYAPRLVNKRRQRRQEGLTNEK